MNISVWCGGTIKASVAIVHLINCIACWLIISLQVLSFSFCLVILVFLHLRLLYIFFLLCFFLMGLMSSVARPLFLGICVVNGMCICCYKDFPILLHDFVALPVRWAPSCCLLFCRWAQLKRWSCWSIGVILQSTAPWINKEIKSLTHETVHAVQ